jgi:hypothetical protein
VRGKTCKKLKKFVNFLIQNTKEEDLTNKSPKKLYKEMKVNWNLKWPERERGREFIDFCLNNPNQIKFQEE